MKIINYLTIAIMCFFTISCSSFTEPVKNIGLGTRVLSYQTDESVDSLIIPPDLTQPNIQGDYSNNVVIDEVKIISRSNNVEVLRDSYRRWLLVDLPPNEAWVLSKEFFRSYGFIIEKENQKIGILETDYLEMETKVPDKSLGVFRAALSKALQTQYGMPIADKYRIRIEPNIDSTKSEIYLTLSSIGEVVSGEMRLWQPRDKDVEIETEMLLKLMVFLGEDHAEAIGKIENNTDKAGPVVNVVESENGYASLVFPFNKKQSWRYLGWALDELGVDIEDRDSVDGSYYIKVQPDKGFFSKLLSSTGSIESLQLYVKQTSDSSSEVYFIDLSQENKEETIAYSFEFFTAVSNKF
jgi:outer membrane protein assembly factor BamC|tara:strand:+ start:336 stop:1394 length:1059 start_codon:yes stop_codon:yes gene_type:complete